MTGVERIAAERKRQIEAEGWTAEHDDDWVHNELALAASCYVMPKEHRKVEDDWGVSRRKYLWPWDKKWWSPTPKNRIRELEKAGALIAAEIDRLLRLEEKNGRRKEKRH
jgi:hypothetical protein